MRGARQNEARLCGNGIVVLMPSRVGGATLAVATGCHVAHIGRNEADDGLAYFPHCKFPLPTGLWGLLPAPYYRAYMSSTQKKAAPPVVSRQRKTRYWHGGAPGLAVGDYLVPAREHGSLFMTGGNHVFLTPLRDVALRYAQSYPGGGALYEARPVGKVKRSLSLSGDISHRKAARAEILAVEVPRVEPNAHAHRRFMLEQRRIALQQEREYLQSPRSTQSEK